MPDPPLPLVFNRRQALDAGYSRGQVTRRLSSGAWKALRWGTYCHASALADADPSLHHRLLTLAALVAHGDATAPGTRRALAPGPGRPARASTSTAVSHTSAACLYGWPRPLEGWGKPHLTTARPDGRSSRRAGLVIHTAALDEGDVVVRHGVPVTSAARTVVDVLRLLPAPEAIAMADHALRVGDSHHADVRSALAKQSGRPRVGKARRAFALTDPRRESWLESWSFITLLGLGVPLPVPQARVLDEHDRFVARVDAYWPAHATVGEADGSVKYDLRGPFVAAEATSPDDVVAWGQRRLDQQRVRHERLLDLGLSVVRWSARDVIQDAPAVAERLRARFSRSDGRALHGRIVLPPALPWETDGVGSSCELRA